nr:acyltransferase family protein [uncultured Duncaniella sp.]
MKRVGWIDYAKSTGIFLVVLLHTHCTYATTSFLSAFRLPLFFFISGFLFSYRSNPDYKRLPISDSGNWLSHICGSIYWRMWHGFWS